MNPAQELQRLYPLRNRYFGLRHGQSQANEQGLIVSSPGVGVRNFGLTQAGKDAVEACQLPSGEKQIYSSDFLRTRETAGIVADSLGLSVELSVLLRERYFGDWDLQSSENYDRVWDEDLRDPTHTEWKVESVQSVADRMSKFIRRCEGNHQASAIVLVSHGDPLQILECLFRQIPMSRHRELPSLEPAELREFRG